MASLVSPITEEAAFRGYCQVILEREFTAPIAVLISSVFFTAPHVVHGFLWPKLLVYFLVGVVFGVIAYFANSTVPAIPVHIIGDLTFFTLVWPYDAARRLVWEGGAERWFWIHAAQAIIFTALAIPAFVLLARVSKRSPAFVKGLAGVRKVLEGKPAHSERKNTWKIGALRFGDAPNSCRPGISNE